MILAFAI